MTEEKPHVKKRTATNHGSVSDYNPYMLMGKNTGSKRSKQSQILDEDENSFE